MSRLRRQDQGDWKEGQTGCLLCGVSCDPLRLDGLPSLRRASTQDAQQASEILREALPELRVESGGARESRHGVSAHAPAVTMSSSR